MTKITLSGTGVSHKLAPGTKVVLKAAVFPDNATNKQLTWKSSNKKVATVSQKGVVTIKKTAKGKKVVITATAKDGSNKKVNYNISVMKGIVSKVTLVKPEKIVKAGNTLKLNVKVTAAKGANKKLYWISSNKKYATVNAKGVVKALKAGKGKKVKITVMATDGSQKKQTVTIAIK